MCSSPDGGRSSKTITIEAMVTILEQGPDLQVKIGDQKLIGIVRQHYCKLTNQTYNKQYPYTLVEEESQRQQDILWILWQLENGDADRANG